MKIHNNHLKTLTMKKTILILIASIRIIFSVSAQSVGDYRSVGNGNWNDATKWEIYNGSNWVSSNSYPGQNPGTGAVAIMIGTEIKITANVPHPVASLFVDSEPDYTVLRGVLTFSSESAVSLTVSGGINIIGKLGIDNQNGAKTHTLFAEGSFWVGIKFSGLEYPAIFQTINQDDKLNITFNTTNSTSSIFGTYGTISFQDITFNGAGIIVGTGIEINGSATFINGIVTISCEEGCDYNPFSGAIAFTDGATVSGASNASFVDGTIWKAGDEPFTFPTGVEGIYAPLTISAPVGKTESFGAKYVRSNGMDLGAISDPGLFNISNCEYWTLAPGFYNVNNYSLNVTAGWTPASGCGSSPYITNVNDVTLAHFNGATWNSHGGTGMGTTTNGSVTSSVVTTSSHSAFTLGNLGTGCDAPSGLSATDITTNSATISWSPLTGSVSYDVYYSANYSSGPGPWINAATATTSTSVNLSGLYPWTIYDWKVRANCSSASSSYRQAQFTTLSTCGTPTGLSTTNITSGSATLSWAAVTNATNYDVEYKKSTATSWLDIATGISSLSYNLGGLSASTVYDWRVQANCSVFPGYYAQASFITTPNVCNDVYETNNTSGQAKTIGSGITISAGIFSASDVDWFKVTTSDISNTTLQVILTNLPADYDLYVYNKYHVLVGSSTTTGTSNEVVIYNSNTMKTTYYIEVIGKYGAYNASLCYNLLAQVNSTAQSVSSVSNRGNEITEASGNQLLYPNPVSEFVFLRFNCVAEGAAKVQILNGTGQLVKLYSVNLTKGYNQVQISVTDIRPGMYLLRINNGELNMIRKFVIAR
jgi:hypothetical protein